jgi:integrase/recombinase XerD
MTKSFVSCLRDDLREFLVYKRAAGRYTGREEYRLRSLDRFAAEHARRAHRFDVPHVIRQWVSRVEGRKARTVARELAMMREFLRFLQRRGSEPTALDPLLLPRLKVQTRFHPYIFSLEEMRLLLLETRTLRAPPIRAFTFKTLLLVLFCTGLRPGEAVRLALGDVDFRARVFFIRKSKGRARWVPFHDELAQRLRAYLEARVAVSPPSPTAPLFIQPTGRAYTAGLASWILRHLFRRVGLKPRRGRVGPRPYDIRHTFAVHCLTRWYREGIDLHARLPWLSAYMGHEDILGTEAYLTATPELLQFASRRFAARFHRRETT